MPEHNDKSQQITPLPPAPPLHLEKGGRGEARQTGVALTAAERIALLRDIERIGLLLGADQTQTLPLARGERPDEIVSPLERLYLLTECWAQARPLLANATTRQAIALHPVATSTPLSQSRGGAQTAQSLARRPRHTAAWFAETQSRNAIARITELRPQASADTQANRFVVTLLEQWRGTAQILAALAAFCDETAAAGQMAQISREAAQWRNRPEWRGLAPLSAAQMAAVAPNFTRWPAAHRALAELWLAERRGLRLDWQRSLKSHPPALESWRLYEIWCYLRVAEALRGAGWRVWGSELSGGAKSCAIRVSVSGVALQLNKGRESELRFTRSGEVLWLVYQPLFPSANQAARQAPREAADSKMGRKQIGFVSRSHAMQPDISLLYGDRLYLLDPKFRAYTAPYPGGDFAPHQDNALLDDINKMHVYRDAIVCGGLPAARAAWCLFPGEPGEKEQSVENPLSLIAYPRSTPDCRFGTAGVGAIRLRPGNAAPLLYELLALWTRGVF